jgi:hypothetical protein
MKQIGRERGASCPAYSHFAILGSQGKLVQDAGSVAYYVRE